MEGIEIGLDCIEVLKKKLNFKITREEFYISLLELHKKYPKEGHDPPLTAFQIRNYKKLKVSERIGQAPKFKDQDLETVYENHLQPFNFQEAAEMFIRHQKKLDEEFLPLGAWRKKEWPLTHKPKHEIKPPDEQAQKFEQKKSKIRYPYKDD